MFALAICYVQNVDGQRSTVAVQDEVESSGIAREVSLDIIMVFQIRSGNM